MIPKGAEPRYEDFAAQEEGELLGCISRFFVAPAGDLPTLYWVETPTANDRRQRNTAAEQLKN